MTREGGVWVTQGCLGQSGGTPRRAGRPRSDGGGGTWLRKEEKLRGWPGQVSQAP